MASQNSDILLPFFLWRENYSQNTTKSEVDTVNTVVVQSQSHVWLFMTSLSHTSLLCPLSPGVCSDSCPLRQWCYVTISIHAAPLCFWLQSFSEPGSFPMSWLFTSGGWSITSNIARNTISSISLHYIALSLVPAFAECIINSRHHKMLFTSNVSNLIVTDEWIK